LLLRQIDGDKWQAMARPARKLRQGEKLTIVDRRGQESSYSAVVEHKDDDGTVTLSVPDINSVLARAGQVPLPHYITETLSDVERYQTVFAREPGSVAAPTAGLHFTDEILGHLRESGIEIAWVTLHVGPGTFQPVKVEDAMQHQMHAEQYLVGEETLEMLRGALRERRRVIAVGTTSCRTLEAISGDIEEKGSLKGETSLYITPGYQFKVVSGLLTNFHLPKSTLLLLVSAFAGRESVLRSYSEAVAERYRFYSFGDAMLIL
ncbi:MAG: tRNA preQ1(34) S-adenosylmethionine ribosyltransferase-isomerase QueA, partial [Thermomicrobiaceae bacterium]